MRSDCCGVALPVPQTWLRVRIDVFIADVCAVSHPDAGCDTDET